MTAAESLSFFSGGLSTATNTTTTRIALTTLSSSTSSGALVVTGGLGIGGTLYAGTATFVRNVYLNSNALGNISGATTVNVTLGNYVTATATGAVQWTFTGTIAGTDSNGFILRLTNGGAFAQTWPSGTTKWASGTAPTLTSSGTDVLVFLTDDGGANWRGVVSVLDSR
jgi:hypothetical protein